MSHVLLPVFALVRRADLAEVIGVALAAGKSLVDEKAAQSAVTEVLD